MQFYQFISLWILYLTYCNGDSINTNNKLQKNGNVNNPSHLNYQDVANNQRQKDNGITGKDNHHNDKFNDIKLVKHDEKNRKTANGQNVVSNVASQVNEIEEDIARTTIKPIRELKSAAEASGTGILSKASFADTPLNTMNDEIVMDERNSCTEERNSNCDHIKDMEYPDKQFKLKYSNALHHGRDIAIIGGGFAGLSAALEMKSLGFNVTIYERNSVLGGRAKLLKSENGTYTFDAGPSWYWMPDIFDKTFERYNRSREEFYNITLLNPAYRVYFPNTTIVDVPGTLPELLEYASSKDPDHALDLFFDEAKEKCERGVWDWIWRPMRSIFELLDLDLIRAAITMDMFGGFEAHVNRYVADDEISTLLKWPVIFVGASPRDSPAMYSLLTYAGHAQGTWYPTKGGMNAPIQALKEIALDMGIKVQLNTDVSDIKFDGKRATHVCTATSCNEVLGVVAAGDYFHIEQNLFPPHLRKYDHRFWKRQVMSPSCIVFYLGFNKKVKGLLHHTFFFDEDLETHLETVFVHHKAYDKPTFYVATTSISDENVAPVNHESVFVLVPISYKLNGTDTQIVRDEIFELVLNRLERNVNASLGSNLVFRKDYGPSDFEKDYYSFRGNAFGLANILSQSLVFKPSIDSVATNVVFAGHLSHPGPGVPPSIVSGIVAANLLQKKLNVQDRVEQWDHMTDTFWLLLSSFVCIVVTLHIVVGVAVWRIKYLRSCAICVELLYLHGRTYFAAATLMNLRKFLDTAAMYALFRVADDYVDIVDGTSEDRRKGISTFKSHFYECLENGVGDYDRHPVLPAVIASAKRLEYPKSLFERFFKSMEMDIDENICETMDDTMKYMDGSAAVIGDFMLPILMANDSDECRAKALKHARDLGNAFQLTNMIRDIDEDLDLGRQYVPESICKEFNVNLSDRDHYSENFVALIEHMFTMTDDFYVSADIGIGMLPAEVRDVIRTAKTLYHEIHDEIRKADYRIFDGRVRVKFSKKVKLATSLISPKQICQIIAAELYFITIRLAIKYCFPLLLVVATFVLTTFNDPDCTYLQVHIKFTIPALLFLLMVNYKDASADVRKKAYKWAALLCFVATIYTTPWDNLLIYLNVWSYHKNRILGTIFFVPVEEHAFFVIETLIVAGFWLCSFPNEASIRLPTGNSKMALAPKPSPLFGIVTLFLVTSWIISLYFTYCGGEMLYIGLILVWAVPVLLLQWIVGSKALLANASNLFFCCTFSIVYLCMVDRWAIAQDTWFINTKYTIPMLLDPILPVEEALFFVVTTFMCACGITLAMVATQCMKTTDGNFLEAVQMMHNWGLPPSNDKATKQMKSIFFCNIGAMVLCFTQDFSTYDSSTLYLLISHCFVAISLHQVAIKIGHHFQPFEKFTIFCAFSLGLLMVWKIAPLLVIIVAMGVGCFNIGQIQRRFYESNTKGLLAILESFARGGMTFAGVYQFPRFYVMVLKMLELNTKTGFGILCVLNVVHAFATALVVMYYLFQSHKPNSLLFVVETVLLNVLFRVVYPPAALLLMYFVFVSPRLLSIDEPKVNRWWIEIIVVLIGIYTGIGSMNIMSTVVIGGATAAVVRHWMLLIGRLFF